MTRLLALFCLALAMAAAQANPYRSKPEAAQAGAKLYRRHCAGCHGQEAKGNRHAASLRSPAVRNASDEALYRILTNGVMRRGMPSWAGLPEQQRWQIVTWLKSLK